MKNDIDTLYRLGICLAAKEQSYPAAVSKYDLGLKRREAATIRRQMRDPGAVICTADQEFA
jgi:hypothetical protein